jgi:hypothetical protein
MACFTETLDGAGIGPWSHHGVGYQRKAAPTAGPLKFMSSTGPLDATS